MKCPSTLAEIEQEARQFFDGDVSKWHRATVVRALIRDYELHHPVRVHRKQQLTDELIALVGNDEKAGAWLTAGEQVPAD